MQETIVRLKVLSQDRTPEQISATIGLPCDRSWRIGDMRPHTFIKEKNNGWVLGSGLPKTAPLEEHIDALLSVLDARADSVRSLATATSEVVVSCVVYADSPPALYFGGVVIKTLARLGAGLDVDLYINESDAT